MATSTTAQKRAALRRRARDRTSSSVGLTLGLLVVVVVAAVIATLGTGGEPQGSGFDLASFDAPVVDGAPVATGTTGGPAPVVRAPALLSEGELVLPADGAGTMVVFLAHWCQFCNAEVPVVTQWLQDAGLPMGTELVTVATAIDPTKPNFPPDTWLRDRDWVSPTVVDADGSIAAAYGVDSFPYWVFVDGQGTVVGSAGPMQADDLTRVAEELAAP